MNHHSRQFETILGSRLQESPRFIQLVSGPRQVGKTTGVIHTLETLFQAKDYLYYECEEAIHDPDWFLRQVQRAEEERAKIIIFDEIQKIDGWSELVKLAWDRQKRKKKSMHWVLLGSSSLRLTQGAHDSLAGRFEPIPVHHWGFLESQKAFGLSLDEYINFGGYPGSYPLRNDPNRFQKYLLESVFESVVNRDIFRFVTIKKPALFRQAFMLACQSPAQEVSYNRLLGQLHDAGNVDQVKHYLELYSQAYLIRLLFKFSHKYSRTSSPKLLPAAPVFTRLFLNRSLTPEEQGFVFESIVGTRLCESFETVYYWRDGQDEIDFVVEVEGRIIGLEVKSKARTTLGMANFKKAHKNARTLVIDMKNYSAFEKDPISFIKEFAG